MDKDLVNQQNMDPSNGPNPQQMHSDAQSQHASQNGDNFMLGGLASRRGGNEGNEMMAGSVVEPSAHRFDQHHPDVNVSQSQSNFNPAAFGMLGASGQQPNMNSMSSLQDPNNSGQYGQSSGGPAGSNPMPQLQQLMMLLQQNQQQSQPQNPNGGGGGSGPNNSSFGPGLMQAAQMLVQSQNQANRFDTSKDNMYRMNPAAGGPNQYDQTSMMNQSMNFGSHGGIPQPNKGMDAGGFMNPMAQGANNSHANPEIPQHMPNTYNRMHDQMQGGQQRNDFNPRDMGGMPPSMQMPNNQWMNPPNMHNQMMNNYMPGGGMNSGPPSHNMQNQMPGGRVPPGMTDQSNSPQIPWGVGSNYGGAGGQRGIDNAYDLQNMSMASLAPQPLDHQLKTQQQAYPTHFSTFLQDERNNQGSVAGMGAPGGGPGGPQGPKGYNENRENIAGPNREKFFTDEYGARNRMSSMNMGKQGLEEGMPPNNRGGPGPPSSGGGGGVSWLSSQNQQQNEYPNQNDKFKMQDKPVNPASMENNPGAGVMWLTSQNKKPPQEEEDNMSNHKQIVWPSRAPERENINNQEYGAKGARGGNRGKYDSQAEDNMSSKFGRDNQGGDEYNHFWPSQQQQPDDLGSSQNFPGNEGNRFGGGNSNQGRQIQSEDGQFNAGPQPRRSDQTNQGQYNNLNSGRLGASNESNGAITPTNLGGQTSELQLQKNNSHSQNSQTRQKNRAETHSDNLMDEEAFKHGDADNYDGAASDNRPTNAIDDIPIPVSKPKTFEELLEEEMAKGNAGGIIANPRSPNKQHQDGSAADKKQFLKRKNAQYGIPTGRQKSTGKKSYRYYADNFDPQKRAASRGPTPSSGGMGGGFGGGSGGGFGSEAIGSGISGNTSNNAPINKFEAPLPGSKPTFNQWQAQMSEDPDKIKEQKSPHSSQGAVVKRPFLARGSGKAGGKGLKSSNSKTPLRQPASKEAQGNTGMKSPLNNEFLYDQNQSNNFDNQLDTFKSLEDRAREQSKNLQNTYLENQKKNQKLFEDDSEEEIDSTQDPKEHRDPHHAMDHEDNRSNLVKKMFYKDKEKDQNLRKSGAESSGHSSKMGAPSMSNLPDSVQKMLEDKKEQLDKAMKFYNSEQQKLNSQKQIYDQQMKKLKIDQKELDVQRKRQKEQFDKMKDEEMSKMKSQKRIIEQRQKNVTLANTSSKRDKDEIESLRKQLTAVKDELAQKEKYSKAQIDRLNRTINDIRAENGELRDEIAHYDQELRELREQQFQSQVYDNNQMGGNPNPNQGQNQQKFTGIGQGVLNRRGSRNSSSVQRQNSNTRNSNANAGVGKQSRQSAQARQTSIEEFQNQEKQIKDQEDYAGSNMISRGNDPQNRHQNATDNSLANLSEVNEANQEQNNDDQVTPDLPANGDEQNLDNEEEDYEMKFPHHYHNKEQPNTQVQDQIVGNDGKVQRTYINGKKEVIFSNGVRRETFPDGYTIVYFNNNDIKQTYPDQKIVYYFAEAKTTQTTYPDGLQVFKFSNSQIEKHYSDGTKEIIFPDGTIKCIFADGEEESIFTDGTIQRIEKNGVKAIEYASGQKDILYPDGTRVREYPDGRIKTTYADGTTENQIKRD